MDYTESDLGDSLPQGPRSLWRECTRDEQFAVEFITSCFHYAHKLLHKISTDHPIEGIFSDWDIDVAFTLDDSIKPFGKLSNVENIPEIVLIAEGETGPQKLALCFNFESFRSLALGIPEVLAFLNAFTVAQTAYNNLDGVYYDYNTRKLHFDKKIVNYMNLAVGLTIFQLGYDETRYLTDETGYSEDKKEFYLAILDSTREFLRHNMPTHNHN